jgi:hypothetical protein
MVCFQTKNPNLGKFWRVLLWKILVYFMTIWSTLQPLEIFYGHFVFFCGNLVYFPPILDQKNLATLVYADAMSRSDSLYCYYLKENILLFHKTT